MSLLCRTKRSPVSRQVPENELAERRAQLEATTGYRPVDRDRVVSPALQAYAAIATSADTDAVRDVDAVERAVAQPAAAEAQSGATA